MDMSARQYVVQARERLKARDTAAAGDERAAWLKWVEINTQSFRADLLRFIGMQAEEILGITYRYRGEPLSYLDSFVATVQIEGGPVTVWIDGGAWVIASAIRTPIVITQRGGETAADFGDRLLATIADVTDPKPGRPAPAEEAPLTPGALATCSQCGKEIVYIGPYWRHVGPAQPRHPAMPREEGG